MSSMKKLLESIDAIQEGTNLTRTTTTTIADGQSFLHDIAKAFAGVKDRTLRIEVKLKDTNTFEYSIVKVNPGKGFEIPSNSLAESIDVINESTSNDVTIKFTRSEALKHGLLTCKCGHPENNHFNHTDSCARCDCKKYREIPVTGKLIAADNKLPTPNRRMPTPRDVMNAGNQSCKR